MMYRQPSNEPITGVHFEMSGLLIIHLLLIM